MSEEDSCVRPRRPVKCGSKSMCLQPPFLSLTCIRSSETSSFSLLLHLSRWNVPMHPGRAGHRSSLACAPPKKNSAIHVYVAKRTTTIPRRSRRGKNVERLNSPFVRGDARGGERATSHVFLAAVIRISRCTSDEVLVTMEIPGSKLGESSRGSHL